MKLYAWVTLLTAGIESVHGLSSPFSVKVKQTGQCVDFSSTSSGYAAVRKNCNNGANQVFVYDSTTQQVQSSANHNLCWTVSTELSTQDIIFLATCSTTNPKQQIVFRKLGSSNFAIGQFPTDSMSCIDSQGGNVKMLMCDAAYTTTQDFQKLEFVGCSVDTLVTPVPAPPPPPPPVVPPPPPPVVPPPPSTEDCDDVM
ncbi:hypothetical protein Poli38472_006600 [Pythium oligandrum]|uniref:Ricin B lectin domain-containing protein n=1 Tax=Pythium oligandrum TaxID=41045 RepID=A0A8K1C534_PYTOL|nr:hypothetical protein Poli38472_006600 [Pythium oligandrum]|eukprot:TMW56590.1 hypothetical protein Poli38472_006600 [Pythium oligandrum]